MSPEASDLRIGGVEPISTVDFPGRLAAVIFCQGCPLACGYCHNPALIPARADPDGPGWRTVVSFLERRRGLLDAVVFSGGEPLSQRALEPAVSAVKALGYAVGLHTAGTTPDRLAWLLPLLDWVGFDVKAPFSSYAPVTGSMVAGAKARRSLARLLERGIAHEVRVTVWPPWHDGARLAALIDDLLVQGVRACVLQEARDADRRPWRGAQPLREGEGEAGDPGCRDDAVAVQTVRKAVTFQSSYDTRETKNARAAFSPGGGLPPAAPTMMH